MTGKEYVSLAMRTCNIEKPKDKLSHGVYGLVSEIVEVHELLSKDGLTRGNRLEHIAKECGDVCWFVAEIADVFKFDFDNIKQIADETDLDYLPRWEWIRDSVGQMCGAMQKTFQGHRGSSEDFQKWLTVILSEISRVAYFYCGINLDKVMELNIEKLKKRFPDGFEVEKSLHRAEGDI